MTNPRAIPDQRARVCPLCPERVPVERLRVGDVVQAVSHGPTGIVEDADRRGWTLVRYAAAFRSSASLMPYRHGVDRLLLIKAASDEERQS